MADRVHPDATGRIEQVRAAGRSFTAPRDGVHRALHRHPADEPDRPRRRLVGIRPEHIHIVSQDGRPVRVKSPSISGPTASCCRARWPTGLGAAGRLWRRARRDINWPGRRRRHQFDQATGAGWCSNRGGHCEELSAGDSGRGAGGAADVGASGRGVDLTMYYPVAVGGPVTKIIDDMVGRFEKDNPDIKVTAVYAGNYTDTMTKAMTAMKGGQPPNCRCCSRPTCSR